MDIAIETLNMPMRIPPGTEVLPIDPSNPALINSELSKQDHNMLRLDSIQNLNSGPLNSNYCELELYIILYAIKDERFDIIESMLKVARADVKFENLLKFYYRAMTGDFGDYDSSNFYNIFVTTFSRYNDFQKSASKTD